MARQWGGPPGLPCLFLPVLRRGHAPLLALLAASALYAQTDTGVLRGVVLDGRGRPVTGARVAVRGGPAEFQLETETGAGGEFRFTLPYGAYGVSVGQAGRPAQDRPGGLPHLTVPPLGEACVKLVPGGEATPVPCPAQLPRFAAGSLATLGPTTVAEPPVLDAWPAAGQVGALPMLSQRGFSWTSVRYTLQGVSATDSYQPGRTDAPLAAPAIEEVVLRTGFEAPRVYGSEIAGFAAAPPSEWHGSIATSNTAGFLASDNLPGPTGRGLVRQPAKYHSYTNDRLQLGGPAGRRIDWIASVGGQWSSQTVPLAAPGADLSGRLLLGSAIARAQLTARDTLQLDFSGSHAHLSNWGMPAGIEAWLGRRNSPSFTLPGIEGFPDTPETDSFYAAQAAWTRMAATGAWQARIAASRARLDTRSEAAPGAQSVIELTTGAISGAAPLSALGTRTRQTAAGLYQSNPVALGRSRHLLALGVEWDRAAIRNLYAAPGGMNFITADGQPAYAVVFNTGGESRHRIHTVTADARDSIALWPWLTVEAAVTADFARGGPIAWNSLSPKAGFALSPGFLRRFTLRGSYARLYAPLAGRYLDFDDPASLGGVEYQWLDHNRDGRFEPGEAGSALAAFGGPVSAIDPALRRPYADQIDVSLDASLPARSFARASFFRRDEKNRLAGVNVGVPDSAFSPVGILDPGPDGMPGTFDDQALTVYAQQPATFGQDRYLLTNPPGLRSLGEGMVVEIGSRWRRYGARASFMALKSTGPANPGNSPLENDPGVIGSLFADPNTLINASGRHFFDRAYVGKVQFFGALPEFLGGIEWENAVNYMDGAAFARRLLVTGLPQGPIIVDATVRGSPGGGNRAEYVFNWNLRLGRTFRVREAGVRASVDIVNVTNNANKIREMEASGPSFNQRLPIALPPARFVRVNLEYAF